MYFTQDQFLPKHYPWEWGFQEQTSQQRVVTSRWAQENMQNGV